MNVIFLDCDGVINTRMWDENKKRLRYFFPSDGKCNNRTAVEWVNVLGEEVDAKIVVSSTWRNVGLDEMKGILANSGLRLEVIGITPSLKGDRGLEIQAWLDENPYVDKYVILDDDADMAHLMDHLVRCDHEYGFTLYKKDEALRNFNKQ